MVGLVVVSHSRALARAAVALAEEMVRGRPVRFAVAAGLDESTFGTDAVQIVEAITAADDGDGVVVLMDLGSAVLSSDLALDLLAEDLRHRVLLCDGPLVEGLVVAAVAAAGGDDRHRVASAASEALSGKRSQLGLLIDAPSEQSREQASGAGATSSTAESGVFTLTNPSGLHLRPAARLVEAVSSLDADVRVRNLTTGAGPVPASSLTMIATIGALRGHQIEVVATGSQAAVAVARVLDLARRSFGPQ